MSESDPLETYERHYCLRWKYHHSNLQSMFAELLEEESFCDVTLACEGKSIRAHKLMLSASSPYFYTLFSQYEETEPIVILKDVKYDDIKTLIDFMYKGEIKVENSQLNSLLHTAKELQIKCLAAVSWLYEDGSLRRVETSQNMSTSLNKVFTLNKPLPNMKKRKLEECSNIPLKDPCPKESTVMGDSDEKLEENKKKVKENDSESRERTGDSAKVMDKEQLSEEGEICPPVMIDNEKLSIDDKSSTKVSSKKSMNSTNGGTKYFKDIVTMTQYIQQGGKRPNFWDIPSTKRILEAIKNKEMEMKRAAIMLGVSYGTLYGRYRDCYGYLKHPYRVREFWLEPESINIISQITRKEISLFKGAEMLNVSATSLANYLATKSRDFEEVECFKEEDEDIKGLVIKKEEDEDIKGLVIKKEEDEDIKGLVIKKEKEDSENDEENIAMDDFNT